jgi:hypothetical protein
LKEKKLNLTVTKIKQGLIQQYFRLLNSFLIQSVLLFFDYYQNWYWLATKWIFRYVSMHIVKRPKGCCFM